MCYTYDGDSPVVEASGQGSVTAVNTFGADGLLSRHAGAGAGSGGSAFDPQGSVAQSITPAKRSQVAETGRGGVAGRISGGLGALLILGGAAGVLVGALGPWAHVTVFHNIELQISGLLFTEGGLCLSAAILVLLGMRRSPLLCAVAALAVLHWAAQARVEIPHRVKHQVIGAQLALFPLNRLLDQFHIDDVQVGDWGVPDADLLAGGLSLTVESGALLLLGSLLGLPTDPAVAWVWTRAVPARCRACGAHWPRSRAAAFCPQCAAPISATRVHHCPQCGTAASSTDRHCIACGDCLARISAGPGASPGASPGRAG